VVVERVGEKVVREEWMAVQVWELDKILEEQMIWNPGCQMIFLRPPSQRHPFQKLKRKIIKR
jgi:hypothetical protein